ncbi:MAG: murein L,D-transpeptidase YcbB/YkuD [Myxococcota bacterium]
MAAAMVSYWPRHPFYAKARTAHKRYSGYDKDGSVPGWAVRGTVKRGSKGSKVIKLRQRLAAEGYYEGDMESSKFDPKLGEAVKRYQASHQLNVDGIVRNSHGLAGLTRTSLAVPMSQRARQLALSLQRWRESPSHKEGEDFYFRVNVPQFEVEVWDGDKQVRKHRIIVGNNKMEVDPDHGRKGHLNRTALISDDITTVVINPVWNIPARIKISEIMVEAAKDPEYLNKHGYRVRTVGDRQHIYQEAGPGNALGRVKLLFPNKHSIYMHDTPKKRLFKRTVRAFSHGCMRLHDPMDMATFLLERQDLMTGTEVQRVLATKKERGIRLKPSVPIHIEYNTIAFEPDSDNPIFLNDVYRYDRAYYDGKLPLQPFERIPIVKTETPDLIVDEEGRVIVPEPEPEPGVEGVDGVEGAEGVEGAPTEEAPAPVAQPDPEAKPEETPEPAPTAPLNEPGPDD